MAKEKKISIAVIRRLPRYYRYLSDLLKMDIKRISSKELSGKMGITASQIRQDLNNFGGFGQQGYGYNVESLFLEISKILGVDHDYNIIIIGAGNMGQALANYENFERRGFKFVGIFDVNPLLIGKKIRDVEIMDMKELENFTAKTRVDIAILTAPSRYIPEIVKRVSDLGIKGIWNYSAMDLKLEKDTIIENVHLSDSLMVLGYRLKEHLRDQGNC